MNSFTQVAHHKQTYLDKTIRELWNQVQSGLQSKLPSSEQELEWFTRCVSIVASDILTFVDMIHECDNRHNFLAVTVDDYPYDKVQKEIEELFESALHLANHLFSIARDLQQRGYEVDNLKRLKKTITELNWMLSKDESVYESEGYKKLTEEAIREYKTGTILEQWPK
ncbi:MAG: hypothetical protein ACE5PV_13335 [Candidatus Poribacteria bacterium]